VDDAPLVRMVGGAGNEGDQVHGGIGPPYKYRWQFGVPGATSSERTPSYEYPSPGTYTVRLTLTDRTGGKATRSLVVRSPSC